MGKKNKTPLYCYTFSTAAYRQEQESLPENERTLQILMTDIVLKGDKPEMIQSAINHIITRYTEKGFFPVINPPPSYIKRTRETIGRFFATEKKLIEKVERSQREFLKKEVKKIKEKEKKNDE